MVRAVIFPNEQRRTLTPVFLVYTVLSRQRALPWHAVHEPQIIYDGQLQQIIKKKSLRKKKEKSNVKEFADFIKKGGALEVKLASSVKGIAANTFRKRGIPTKFGNIDQALPNFNEVRLPGNKPNDNWSYEKHFGSIEVFEESDLSQEKEVDIREDRKRAARELNRDGLLGFQDVGNDKDIYTIGAQLPSVNARNWWVDLPMKRVYRDPRSKSLFIRAIDVHGEIMGCNLSDYVYHFMTSFPGRMDVLRKILPITYADFNFWGNSYRRPDFAKARHVWVARIVDLWRTGFAKIGVPKWEEKKGGRILDLLRAGNNTRELASLLADFNVSERLRASVVPHYKAYQSKKTRESDVAALMSSCGEAELVTHLSYELDSMRRCWLEDASEKLANKMKWTSDKGFWLNDEASEDSDSMQTLGDLDNFFQWLEVVEELKQWTRDVLGKRLQDKESGYLTEEITEGSAGYSQRFVGGSIEEAVTVGDFLMRMDTPISWTYWKLIFNGAHEPESSKSNWYYLSTDNRRLLFDERSRSRASRTDRKPIVGHIAFHISGSANPAENSRVSLLAPRKAFWRDGREQKERHKTTHTGIVHMRLRKDAKNPSDCISPLQMTQDRATALMAILVDRLRKFRAKPEQCDEHYLKDLKAAASYDNGYYDRGILPLSLWTLAGYDFHHYDVDYYLARQITETLKREEPYQNSSSIYRRS